MQMHINYCISGCWFILINNILLTIYNLQIQFIIYLLYTVGREVYSSQSSVSSSVSVSGSVSTSVKDSVSNSNRYEDSGSGRDSGSETE